MITSIMGNADLRLILRDTIEENGVNILFDNEFYNDDFLLDNEKVVNLAVDSYYNSLRMRHTPPSPDNLVVIKRTDNKFSIYLIELKCVNFVERLNTSNIKMKFTTAINDFMMEKFSDCFMNENHKITDFNIWLVCNRFSFIDEQITDEEYFNKIKGGVMERILLERPYKFRNKFATISLMLSGARID